MSNDLFIKEAVKRLYDYLHPEWKNKKYKQLPYFVVWLSKVADNNKCLIGLYGSDDYFEITYVGKDNAFVLDHYTLKKHIEI